MGIPKWMTEAWDKYQQYKDVVDPVAKTIGSLGKAYIDYKSQKEINELSEEAYNQYMREKQAAGQEAQAAVDLNLMPMAITNVPTTKADVSDFTAVAARGGLMNLPTKQRKRYAFGPNPEDIPTMDDMSPPFDPREEGIAIGEQVFYDTGKGDRSNAMMIWSQMQNPDKAIFDFDFEIFFMDGGWRDMIKSEIEGGTETQMASAPDPMDALNDMSMNVLGKPLHDLTPEEYQMLIDMANEQAAAPSAKGIMQVAKGGRIGYAGGSNGNRYSYLIDKVNKGIPLTPSEAKELQMLEITYADESQGVAQGGRIGYAAQGFVGTTAEEGDIGLEEKIIHPGTLTEGDIGMPGQATTGFEHEGAIAEDESGLMQVAKIVAQLPIPLNPLHVWKTMKMAGVGIAEAIEIVKNKLGKEEIIDEEEFEITPAAKGGRIKKAPGGIMNLGGLEKDYRTTGGFVPIGGRERADDVPARLSKNEFVMTADAVRAAGGGSINRGAQRMYDTMKHLEASPGSKRMTA